MDESTEKYLAQHAQLQHENGGIDARINAVLASVQIRDAKERRALHISPAYERRLLNLASSSLQRMRTRQERYGLEDSVYIRAEQKLTAAKECYEKLQDNM